MLWVNQRRLQAIIFITKIETVGLVMFILFVTLNIWLSAGYSCGLYLFRGVFKTLSNIYEGVFLWKWLKAKSR